MYKKRSLEISETPVLYKDARCLKVNIVLGNFSVFLCSGENIHPPALKQFVISSK